ncbi:MAG: TauD/TfdA family dioxygenase [Burkholderiaceae bacterium]
MSIHFTALHPVFAAEAHGIDLLDLDARAVTALVEGLDRYAVVLVRGQALDELQQIAVGEALGRIEERPATVGEQRRRLRDDRTNDISNLDADGNLLAADHNRRLFNLGNRLWHSDSSFKATPSKYSMLYANRLPASGDGDTEFADMRAAWDALPEKMQQRLLPMVARHSLMYSRAQLGFFSFSEEERERYAPVPQRLVRRHAGSGRRSLYLASHIGDIDGLPRPEAMILVRELTEHATRRENVYRHHWQPHDLVIWDNRCTLHRATAFDDVLEPRDMRRVTVTDDRPSLQEPQ